jgi:hypothetical protein
MKPKLHSYKEYGQKFYPLLHTSYTMDCLTAPLSRDVFSGCYGQVRRPVTALDCVLLKDRNLALASRQGPEINSRACLWVFPRPKGRDRIAYIATTYGLDCPGFDYRHRQDIFFFSKIIQTGPEAHPPTY